MIAMKIRRAHHDFMRKYGYAFEPNALVISEAEYRALAEELDAVNAYPYNLARWRTFMGMTIYRSEDATEPRVMIDPLAQGAA